MDKSITITLIIVVTVLILASFGYLIFSELSMSNTVSVNGQSEITAIPDLVTVYFNIETKGKTSKEAKDLNSDIVDNVIDSLLSLGLERKEIQTQSFNIYPEYNWNSGRNDIIGYIATHSLKVQISTQDFSKIGDIIDAGVDSGAMIGYINFELSQEKQNIQKAEAIKLASEDARLKATSMAIGLGKKLGRLVSVTDSSFDYNPWPIFASSGTGIKEDTTMAREAVTNIQPSEQKIYGNVRATFKLI